MSATTAMPSVAMDAESRRATDSVATSRVVRKRAATISVAIASSQAAQGKQQDGRQRNEQQKQPKSQQQKQAENRQQPRAQDEPRAQQQPQPPRAPRSEAGASEKTAPVVAEAIKPMTPATAATPEPRRRKRRRRTNDQDRAGGSRAKRPSSMKRPAKAPAVDVVAGVVGDAVVAVVPRPASRAKRWHRSMTTCRRAMSWPRIVRSRSSTSRTRSGTSAGDRSHRSRHDGGVDRTCTQRACAGRRSRRRNHDDAGARSREIAMQATLTTSNPRSRARLRRSKTHGRQGRRGSPAAVRPGTGDDGARRNGCGRTPGHGIRPNRRSRRVCSMAHDASAPTPVSRPRPPLW